MSTRASMRVENNHFSSARPSPYHASSSSITVVVATCSMATAAAVHVDSSQDGTSEAAILVSGGVLTPGLLHPKRRCRGLKARVVGRA